MRRRTYLGGVTAALGGAAGCLGGGPGAAETETRGNETTTTASSAPARTRATESETAETESETATQAAGDAELRVETAVQTLEVPWGAAFRGDTMYLTERPGRIVRVPDAANGATRERGEVVADLTSETAAVGEGGLLGLVFHPNDPNTAYTYQTYPAPDEKDQYNRILRHDVRKGFEYEVIFDGIPGNAIHNGGRLAIGNGALYATTGENGWDEGARKRSTLHGKVLRLTLDGQPHSKNPFGNAVFSYGHRNPQGLAFRDGRLYSTEHGPDVGDEINVLRKGGNYGWPVVMGMEDRQRFVPPVTAYTPTIAPGSATFYDGPIRAWQGDFFFGTLVGEHLHRVRLEGRRVYEQERLFEEEYGRLRTAFTGPDGHLYVTTSNRDSRGTPIDTDDRVLRIRPV